jgi:5-methyltetrahydrofolate--homocysteine methyltransferase
VLLRSYGFTVIDLGRNVPPQKIVESARKSGAKVVGLSALMTTTLPSMRKTIEALRADNPSTAIVVGGAVLTEEYAKTLNADKYAPAALDTVKFVSEIYGV